MRRHVNLLLLLFRALTVLTLSTVAIAPESLDDRDVESCRSHPDNGDADEYCRSTMKEARHENGRTAVIDDGIDDGSRQYEQEEEEVENYSERECRDNHANCEFWAEEGECKNNKVWMFENCKRACSVCNECQDHDQDCEILARQGECDNSDWMHEYCKESCGLCNHVECEDKHQRCSHYVSIGECDKDALYMYYMCQKSCGKCIDDQLINLGVVQIPSIHDDIGVLNHIIRKSQTYLTEDIFPNHTLSNIHDSCVNYENDCASYAMRGKCDTDPTWARLHCPLACRQCEMLEVSVRCPIDPDAPVALKPGDLNKLFEGILTDEEYKAFQPVVLSRPYRTIAAAEDADGFAIDVVADPWVVTFESFLTDEECDRLIQHGHNAGYEASTVVGDTLPDGTSVREMGEESGRTSENAWCHHECHDDPLVQNVLNRMSKVTGAPPANYEWLQLLKYDVGQFYVSHHDFIAENIKYPMGPRILTFFLYLNDVEEGGGTKFNDLDITVTPKKGKAILWTNVLNDDPFQEEPNTNHEALPVKAGVKYGANAWIHLRDFKTSALNDCL